jgi:hypothetical protein
MQRTLALSEGRIQHISAFPRGCAGILSRFKSIHLAHQSKEQQVYRNPADRQIALARIEIEQGGVEETIRRMRKKSCT